MREWPSSNSSEHRPDRLEEVLIPMKDEMTGEIVEFPSLPGMTMGQFAHIMGEKGYSIPSDRELETWQASKSAETLEGEFRAVDDERKAA